MADLVERLQELSELRRRGSLNSKQFEAAKAHLLRTAQWEPSPKQELEIEQAALDRDWNARQEEFKVNWGFFWRIPEKNEGTQRARLFLVLGSLITTAFTLIALGVTLSGGELVIWMPAFFGVVGTMYNFRFYKRWEGVADAHEKAQAKYYAECAELEAKIHALEAK